VVGGDLRTDIKLQYFNDNNNIFRHVRPILQCNNKSVKQKKIINNFICTSTNETTATQTPGCVEYVRVIVINSAVFNEY
jgi:hypothetical protein